MSPTARAPATVQSALIPESGNPGFALLDCDGCDGESGAGFVIGAGYDLPINRSGSLALTPFVNWIVTTIESNPYFLQFGLGLTFN
jgi:hypothetical protein